MPTYPLNLPNPSHISGLRPIPNSVVGVATSPFTGSQEVQEHQGQWFNMAVNLRPLTGIEARRWAAFFTSLNGKAGTFVLQCQPVFKPLGPAGGAPVVAGAAQTGNSLMTSGWDANATVLLAGDYIQVGSLPTPRLHMVRQDVLTDGSGNATIDIWPRLREVPADGSVIVTDNPGGLFRLTSNQNPWDIETGLIYGFSFNAMEAI